MRTRALHRVLLATAGMTWACGGGDGGTPAPPDSPVPAAIRVVPDSVDLDQGGTAQLRATVLDADGSTLDDVPVAFTSSDTSIVTVSASGALSTSRAGSAEIRLRAGTVSARAPVVVRPVAAAVRLTPDPLLLPLDETAQLTATVLDRRGDPMPGVPVTFTSLNPAVVAVSPTGLLAPVGPQGVAQVTAGAATFADTVTVTVTQPAATITVVPDRVEMYPGVRVRLVAAVVDRTGAVISGVAITFESSNAAIVTVDDAGLLTAVGPLGAATITLRSGSVSRTVPVTVIPTPSPQGVFDGTVTLPDGAASDLAVSPAGEILVGGAAVRRGTVAARTFTTLTVASGLREAVALNGAATTAWLAGDGVAEVDPGTGAVRGTVTGLGAAPPWRQVRVSPNERFVYASGASTLAVIDAATRSTVRVVAIQSSGTWLAADPLLREVFVGGDGPVQALDLQSGVLRTVSPAILTAFTLSRDGTRIYAVTESAPGIRVFDAATGAEQATLPTPRGASGIGLAPDGTKLVLAAGGTILLVDLATQQVIGDFDVGGTTQRVGFEAVNGRAVVSNVVGQLHFIR